MATVNLGRVKVSLNNNEWKFDWEDARLWLNIKMTNHVNLFTI